MYDMLVYTGPSPVNSPYVGFKALFKPAMLRSNKDRREEIRDNPQSDAV